MNQEFIITMAQTVGPTVGISLYLVWFVCRRLKSFEDYCRRDCPLREIKKDE